MWFTVTLWPINIALSLSSAVVLFDLSSRWWMNSVVSQTMCKTRKTPSSADLISCWYPLALNIWRSMCYSANNTLQCVFAWETKIVCVWANVCVMAFHSGQRWRVSGLLRGSDVTKRGVGRDVSQGTLGEEKRGELAERWGNRWWKKGVRRRRRDVCMRTHPVRWPSALAGPGSQECAVVCGWDPPLSAPACPLSPHTSRLFILHCGKITAPPVSSGFCKVYTSHPHTHMRT